MKRLFVAIKLTPDQNFLSIYNFLKVNLNHDLIKWVEPDKLHLTLKFLGKTYEDKIPAINQILENFANTKTPLNISFDKVGIFGSSYDPKVIWFGINENKQIKKFGLDLLNKFNENGFKTDRQNFVPHLTLGRIKKLNNKKHFQKVIDRVKDKPIQEFEINEIILFESILKPDGPIYHIIEKYKLKTN
jgi:2'-5' RNA ligase